MNIGTKITGQMISDSRFLKNWDLKTDISVKRTSLKTALHNTGIEIYSLESERLLNWQDGTQQIRQTFNLVLSKKLTKNQIYEVVNSVMPQPLDIKNNYYN